MRVIVHDMPREQWEKLDLDIREDDIVVWNDGSIHPCTGCFGCWFKTPGRLVQDSGTVHRAGPVSEDGGEHRQGH